MTKTPWTPGPWTINHTWIMAGHLHVATIPHAYDGDWSRNNATLIAEAPAMAEALEQSLEALSYSVPTHSLCPEPLQRHDAAIKAIRAILARIKGEPQ